MATSVAEWRRRGGPARALASRAAPPAVIPRVVAPAQVLELDAVQRRLASVERDRAHGAQARAIAERALDQSNDTAGSLERTLSDAEVAVDQAQRALLVAQSSGAVAADARSRVLSLVQTVAAVEAFARSAGQDVAKALAEFARIGVYVVSIRREGREIVVLYSTGAEERIALPDDRRLMGGFGGSSSGSGGSASPAPFTFTPASADYALSSTVRTFLLVDATAGPVVVTFPLASFVPTMEYLVQKIDASANTVTLTGDSFNGDGDAIITQRNTAAHLYPTATLGYRIG